MENKYSTRTYDESLNESLDDFENEIFDGKNSNKSFQRDFKVYYKLVKKRFSHKIRETFKKNFLNILYLTIDFPDYVSKSQREDSPLEFIVEMRNRYPNDNFRVLVPIINLNENTTISKKMVLEINNKEIFLEKTSVKFEFYSQNRMNEAILYKFEPNNSRVQVYGLYSPAFSYCKDISELSHLQYLAPFMKAVRSCVKNLSSDFSEKFNVDIVHCENIPYYLGNEFELSLSRTTKVLQVIKDFTQIEMLKYEEFWALINLADKRSMQKLCRDQIIKNLIANLFRLHNTRKFYQMRDCLSYIYQNYTKFRKYIDKGDDIEENILFNKLNRRVRQLFPQLAKRESGGYNIMSYSIMRADFWVTASKAYYKNIFENEKLLGSLYEIVLNTKDKSSYVSYGLNMSRYPTEETRQIYNNFNSENFREKRGKNKELLLKELSYDRIKTNFVDSSLFKNEDYKIIGSLDSFYDAPLFFANPSVDTFANGIDILFNTILKLYELHKNIQVIICIKDGLKNSFIRSWIDFLAKQKYLNGKWVFIDGDINLPKFLAGSDIILIPRRINMATSEHYIAMRYGCVPVVSKNGNLDDTVIDIFDDIVNGCGFKTKKNLLTEEDVNELFITPVMKALNLYQNNPASWNLLIKNCLNHDSNWSFKILEKYDKIYNEMI